MFNSSPTRCTLYSLFLSSLAVHVSGDICTHHLRSTTAAYSHRLCMVWYVIALEQVLVWDSFTLKHGQLQMRFALVLACTRYKVRASCANPTLFCPQSFLLTQCVGQSANSVGNSFIPLVTSVRPPKIPLCVTH
jgi:hypothetical protein